MLYVAVLIVLLSRYLLLDAGGHGGEVPAAALLDTTSDALKDTPGSFLLEV